MLAINLRFLGRDQIKREWRDGDVLILCLPCLLAILGGLAIRSTESRDISADWWWQHWFAAGVGLILAVMIARWSYDRLLQIHWLTYAITNISLLVVKFAGNTVNGSQRWLSLGGINIQPSEFAKLGLIITLAAVLHQRPIKHPLDMVKVLPVVSLPWFLIFIQPDLGTALVFVVITLGMLYWAGASLGWLILLGSPLISAIIYNFHVPLWLGWVALTGVIAWTSLPWFRLISTIVTVVVNLVAVEIGNLLWSLLADYQKERLVLFLDPSQAPLDGGYHLIQSRIAIGAGKLWGKGIMQGTQTKLDFIPEQHTDFIFSAIGEELGFVGCAFVLLVFMGICWRLLAIALKSRDDFGSLIAIGFFSLILFQTMVNIGMTIGLAPVTGIPLPWVSYGRSAMIANFMALGLVESVMLHRRTIKF
jgi:rod shape determining protein RodA